MGLLHCRLHAKHLILGFISIRKGRKHEVKASTNVEIKGEENISPAQTESFRRSLFAGFEKIKFSRGIQ